MVEFVGYRGVADELMMGAVPVPIIELVMFPGTEYGGVVGLDE